MKRLLELADRTQAELAEEVGTSERAVTNWLNGKAPNERRLDQVIGAMRKFLRGAWNESSEAELRSAWQASRSAAPPSPSPARAHGAEPVAPPRSRAEPEAAALLPALDRSLSKRDDATLRAILARPVTDVASYVLRRAALLRRSTLEGSQAAGGLHNSFVNLQLRPRAGAEPGAQPQTLHALSELLAGHPDAPVFVLLGDPGGGKSTLLLDLELRNAYAWLAAKDNANSVLADGGNPEPSSGSEATGQLPELCLRVPLADYKPAKDGGHPDPAQWLASALQRHCQRAGDTPPDLAALASHARIRWLLDGFNEVPAQSPAQRLQAQGALMRWAAAQGGPGGLAPLITVRHVDYQRVDTGVDGHGRPDEVDVLPWTDDQVLAYINRYFGATGAALAEQAVAPADGPSSPMAKAIVALPDAQRRQLLALLRNPFNLKLQCDLYRADGGRLADHRGDLLGRIALLRLDAALRAPSKLPGVPEAVLHADDHRAVADLAGPPARPLHAWKKPRGRLLASLTALARALHERDGAAWSRFAIDELPARPGPAGTWPDIEPALAAARALLLVDGDAAAGTLHFAHQLWQEYLAAIALARGRQAADWPDFAAPGRAPEPAWELPAPVRSEWDQCVQLALEIADDPLPLLDHLTQVNPALAGRAAASRWQRDAAQADRLPSDVRDRLNGLRRRLLDRQSNPQLPVAQRIEAGELLGDLGDTLRYQSPAGGLGHPCRLPRDQWAPDGLGWIALPAGLQRLQADKQTVEVEIAPDLRMSFAPVTVAEFRCFVEAEGYGGQDTDEPPAWWQGAAARQWWRGELANDGARQVWQEVRKHWHAGDPESDAGAAARRRVREFWFSALSHTEFDRIKAEKLDASDEAFQRWLDDEFQGRRHRVPGWWNSLRHTHGTQPVVGVSLFEAEAYCVWLSAQLKDSGRCFRLPTEAEWSVLAQGGARREWPWRDDPDRPLTEHMNFLDVRIWRPTPVGAFPGGRSAEGAVDLAGNVWEWCGSRISRSDRGDIDGINEAADADDAAVARAVSGGSWFVTSDYCRPAFRGRNLPAYRADDLGFRVLSCPIQQP